MNGEVYTRNRGAIGVISGIQRRSEEECVELYEWGGLRGTDDAHSKEVGEGTRAKWTIGRFSGPRAVRWALLLSGDPSAKSK
ncbi:hypothetical protein Tco_0971642 [Tanacetum coccineum]